MARTKDLTKKQKKFADKIYQLDWRSFWLQLANNDKMSIDKSIVREAARAASYKHRQSVWKLIRNPKILSYIENKAIRKKKKILPWIKKAVVELMDLRKRQDEEREERDAAFGDFNDGFQSNFPRSIELLQRTRRN